MNLRNTIALSAGAFGESGWQYGGRTMPTGYIPKRTLSGFPKVRAPKAMPSPKRFSQKTLESKGGRPGGPGSKDAGIKTPKDPRGNFEELKKGAQAPEGKHDNIAKHKKKALSTKPVVPHPNALLKKMGKSRPFGGKVKAGGPGSGRHKEYGNFRQVRKGRFDIDTKYRVPKTSFGIAVVENRLGPKHSIEELRPSGGMRGALRILHGPTDNKDEIRSVLKDHYGINHKFSSDLKASEMSEPPGSGAYGHVHIDPVSSFRPPSLTKREKDNSSRTPSDDVRETNDRFLDVTKRNSKDTKEQRMKLLRRSIPGGSPPQIPVRTTAIAHHQGVYTPMSMLGSAPKTRLIMRPARMENTRSGMTRVAYGRQGCI